MTMTRATGAVILTPAQVAELLVQPVGQESVAMQVASVVNTGSADYRIPLVTADPQAAWVAEGDEISPSDAVLSEELVSPSKVAGLTIITRELAEDSSPEAAATVGAGLARDIARKVDAAFFGSLAAPAPAGLGSLPTTVGNVQTVRSGVNEVQTIDLGAATAGTITIGVEGQTTAAIPFNATAADVQTALEALSNVAPGDIKVTGGPLPAKITLTFGGAFAALNVGQVTVTPTGLTGGTVTVATVTTGAGGFFSLDAFAEAQSLAENEGVSLTSFVAHPSDALALSTLKVGTGSNQTLLGGQRSINGVQLLVSPSVTPGTIWGIPQERVVVVIREDATVETDKSVFFTSDRVAVKAVMRVGFGFPHRAGLVKITT